MSSGMHHERWASIGKGDISTTVKRNGNMPQAVGLHAYGTSWHSVRLNKPSEIGNRTVNGGCWNRSVPFFESALKKYDTKSSSSIAHFYTQPNCKNNTGLRNSDSYIRERSTRFGVSILSLMNDKALNTTTPRHLSENLINRRSTTHNKLARNARESTFTTNNRWTSPSSFTTRRFQSGVRNTIPISSSAASTSLHNSPFLNITSQTVSSNHGNATLKADRPWRRRMADAARLRIVHGDEIGNAVHSTLVTIRARRRSSTNNADNELQNSLNALKSHINEQTTGFHRHNNCCTIRGSPALTDKSSFDNVVSFKQNTSICDFEMNSEQSSEYMTRSCPPVRPRVHKTKLSKYNSISTDILLRPSRFSQQPNANNLNGTVESYISGRSENKQLLPSAEKKGMVTDNEISVKVDIRKDKAAEEEEVKCVQILNNLETSSLITFSKKCSKESQPKIMRTEYDKAQVDKKKGDNNLVTVISSFVKRKKSTGKCDKAAFKANYSNQKKEVKNATTKKMKGKKCMEGKAISTGTQKMLNGDVQPADWEQTSYSDQRSLSRLSSPTSFSSLNSLPRNEVLNTSTNNLFEDSKKCRDVAVAANSSSSKEVRCSKSKSPAPVPGTWSGPDCHEINISHNKRLRRPETRSSEKVHGVITKKRISCTLPLVTVRATESKSRRPSKIILFNCEFRPLNESNEKVSSSQKYSRIIKVDKKFFVLIPTTIKFDATFTSRRRSVGCTLDIIKMKRKHSPCSLTIKEISMREITVRESICERLDERNSCRAQVTVVISPIADVNLSVPFYQSTKRVQFTHSKRYHPVSVEKVFKQVYSVEENNMALSENDELTLSGRFLIERYMKDKCDKLKHMPSKPMKHDIKESSCSLAFSELMRACAVQTLEPTRQVPYITAPSRSRLGSVEVETVSNATRTCREQLSINLLQYHGLKNSQADRSARSMSLTKPSFEFDTPLSPFEQNLQNQAFQLRKISAVSDSDIPTVQDMPTVDITMQLPVNDHSSSLTSNFTAAVAAAAQPRHERYAAHIPVTRIDKNGRQSTTSIDSYNSGTMETTTFHLDQMNDQTRYKHYQQRNKFREAITYLDQIFDDLKKERNQVDNTKQSREIPAAFPRKVTPNSDTNLMNVAIPAVKLPQHNGNIKRLVDLEQMDAPQVSRVTASRHSLHASKPGASEKYYLREKAASFEHTSENIEIPKIAVLPPQNHKLKNERMDFTRKWLTGNIKSWVDAQPKPDLILGGVEEETDDVDECSLGSCSAEVAAINSLIRKKKKTRDVPDLIQNVGFKGKYVTHSNAYETDPSGHRCDSGQYLQQIDPIKPLPLKAQVASNFPTGSTDNLNNFNSFSKSFHGNNIWTKNDDVNKSQTSLQRFPSHSQVPEQRYGGVLWRSASQNVQHTLSNARSEGVQFSARKTGAFTPLQTPSISTMRGSVTSLPEASNSRLQPLHNTDPTTTIDALVAELELNIDQTSVVSKRRSFPIGKEFFVRHADNYKKSTSDNQQYSSIQSSVETKQNRSEHNADHKQQPQKLDDSFKEMENMLQSVISDVTAPSQLSKVRKYGHMGVKSNSLLSPFETINREKLNPSKVEAMQSIFEKKQNGSVWRRSISNSNSDNIQSTIDNKDDDNYCEIGDFAVIPKEFPSYAKPSSKQSSTIIRPISQSKQRLTSAVTPSRHEFISAFPMIHPPPLPSGSSNSSHTGGYYSSGSSLGAQSSYASSNNHSSILHLPGNRGPMHEKQSVSSRAASEEDDGFYDNIQANEKRFSHGSELDDMSSKNDHHILPTTANKTSDPIKTSNRIGQFLRKITASKPPASAASLVSLNKITNEIMPNPLMKSNSLSYCHEKRQTVQNMDITAPSVMVNKRGRLGQRLKDSIFRSKKRFI